MIENKDGNIEVDGTPEQILEELANITMAICKEFTEATGVNVGVNDLIGATKKLLNSKYTEGEE